MSFERKLYDDARIMQILDKLAPGEVISVRFGPSVAHNIVQTTGARV